MPRNPVTGEPLAFQKPEHRRGWSIELPTEGEFEFDLTLLPSASTFQYLAQRAAEQGVQVATKQTLARRSIDQPERGIVAVMPSDEREARRERPLIYFDNRAGMSPVLWINAANEHMEAVKDRVDEMRHYGTDQPAPYTRPDMQQVYAEYLDQQRRMHRGQRTYGSETRGLINGDGR